MRCRASPRNNRPGTITQATGGPGVINLTFDAEHSTSFDVFQKKSTDALFAKVADDIIENSYSGSLVPPGIYNLKVVGRNSLGEGPESDVSNVMVT